MPNDSNAIVAQRWTVIISFGADIDLMNHVRGMKNTPARAIAVLGASGNLVVKKIDPEDQSETLTGVAAGFVLTGQVKTIVASGTTVTGVVVYW